MVRFALVASLVFALGCLAAGPAAADGAGGYAPLDQPGPALDIPAANLQASLSCESNVRDATVEPVLLSPATGLTAEQNFSWNWEPALNKLGIPWCAYTPPNDALNDIQASGEYIVYAIRTMYAMAGRKIAIMGHSQGGMSMRWALRFWPDTRSMVDKVIGLSGSNHGTTSPVLDTCFTGCPPANWQQEAGSNFVAALNSGVETFAGISYTEIYTQTDEVVEPNTGADPSSGVYTGAGQITNVAIQQVCPLDLGEHLIVGTTDPVAYALALDALTHSGPADPARIPSSACAQLYMPGVNPLDAGIELQVLAGAPGLLSVAVGPAAYTTSGAPEDYSEPPLACYVHADCPGEKPVGPLVQ